MWRIQDLYWIRIDAVSYKIVRCRARGETREGTLMRKDKKMVMNYKQAAKINSLNLPTSKPAVMFSPFFQPRTESEKDATFSSVLKMDCTRVRVSNTFSLEKTSV